MKKDYLFYGAFGIGVIALVAVLATYNLRSRNSTKDQGIDLNASNNEIMQEANDVDVLGDDVTAEDKQSDESASGQDNAEKTNTKDTQANATAGGSTEGTVADQTNIGQTGGSQTATEQAAGSETDTEQTAQNDTQKNKEEKNEEKTETANSKNAYNGSQTLTWPITGDIILPYSMDATVYFQTLEQYKCNPGMLIGAEKGEQVCSVYAGTVKATGKSNEFGEYLILDLGNGYEVYYGQLADIHVEKGNKVSAGDKLASVADPSSYYEKEGCHRYLAVTKDGKPVNPVALMAD